MATLQLGRATLDADAAYAERVTHTVGRVTIRGQILGTAEIAVVARQNLAALSPGDIIPITHTGDPTLDGWYRVRQIQVNAAAGAIPAGLYSYTAQVIRLGGSAELSWQSRLEGVNLDAAAEVLHAVPGTVPSYTPAVTNLVARELSDLTNLYVALDVDRTVRPRWGMDPDEHYRGAAYVKWAQADAGTHYTRQGLWIPSGLSTQYEIGNGLLKLVANADDKAGFQVSGWDPTGNAWETFAFYLTTGGVAATTVAVADTDTVRVLRNDPEEVVVRFRWPRASGNGHHTVTVSLRRGARHFRLRWSRDTTVNLGIFRTSTDAATVGTDYIRDTATAGNML